MTKTWERKRLGDLCQLLSGQHIEAKDYNTDGRGVGYLTGPSDFGELYPIISKWTEFPKVKAESGDILITVKGSGVGKVNLLNQDQIAISRQLMALRVKGADAQFVYAFISSKFDHFQSLATGAAIPGISREQVLGLELTLPPLPEQKRIVSILDEAFEGIATAKANAEQNLTNAKQIFSSYHALIFNQKTDGWNETTIGDQFILQRGFDITKEQQQPGSIPVVSSGGIKSFHNQSMANSPGVVIGRKGTLGKVFFLDENYWPHDTSLWVKDFKGNLPRFVYHFLRGIDVSKLNSGSANPALNRNVLHAINTYWPPVSEQQNIIHSLDSLFDECERLESIYRQKITALDELKKSLLQKAFAGEL